MTRASIVGIIGLPGRPRSAENSVKRLRPIAGLKRAILISVSYAGETREIALDGSVRLYLAYSWVRRTGVRRNPAEHDARCLADDRRPLAGPSRPPSPVFRPLRTG